jgi:hypothetical protein
MRSLIFRGGSLQSENVGIPLGTTVIDVFAHTNTVRQAYKGLAPIDADGIPWEIFTDQLSAAD